MKNTQAQARYIDSLINWVKLHPQIDSSYILTLHRISYRYSENDIVQSFKYYERASMLSDSLNFTYGKSLAQINVGILLAITGNYVASNTAYFKAIDYARACKARRQIAISLNNIGENFKSLNDLARSRQYALQAIEINKELKAWRGVAINYELLHRCDFDEKLYDISLKDLDDGMPFAIKADENYIFSIFFLGYGKVKAIQNNEDSATYYFAKAMSYALHEDDRRNVYQVYKARASYVPGLTVAKKLRLLDSAYAIAKETQYKEGIGESAQMISAIYDQLKMQDSSMRYYHIYRTNYDSMFSENNRRNVIIKETDWQIKQKEIENKHLKELSIIQRRDIGFKNALLAGTGILLLLIIIIFITVNKSVQSKKKRAESDFKEKITATKMESLQAQMNPHFIFNSLNSIENFMMRNERKEASDYLNKFSSLIRLILESSRTHLIPFSQDLEALKLYIQLEQLRFNHRFVADIIVDETLLDGDYQVPPLLIQPYVENAIIHGLSQSESEGLKLTLTANLEGGYVVYIIEDNGIGRAQSAIYNKTKKMSHSSVGLQLTQERIDIFNLQHQAHSNVEITDLYNGKNLAAGTRVRLLIKAV